MVRYQSSLGVVGVFLALLGAGLIFDADWIWRGGSLIAAGTLCLLAERQRPAPVVEDDA